MLKPVDALEEWASLFYQTVIGNPYVREKEVTQDEFDLLIKRAMQWRERQKEQANAERTSGTKG